MKTFAGFPFLTDLKNLKTAVVILGVPFGTPYTSDHGAIFSDSPIVLRKESLRYPDDLDAWDFDLGGTLADIAKGKIADAGDLPGSPSTPEANRTIARETVQKIIEKGAVPVVLGGDDSIPIPVLQAYEGASPFYLLQLDAHIDWRDEVDGTKFGYSSTMRRASEMAHVKGIVQVGMRGVGSARKEEVEAANTYGVNFVMAKTFHQKGLSSVLEHLPDGCRCFITLDYDVLDPSIMPAVGSPTPEGLFYQETIDLIEAVAQRSNVIGVSLVELVPSLDVRRLGAITAMRIAWNVIGSICKNL